MNAEKKRLDEASRKAAQKAAWKKWGPYVTERQWGTVREDYSPYGMMRMTFFTTCCICRAMRKSP